MSSLKKNLLLGASLTLGAAALASTHTWNDRSSGTTWDLQSAGNWTDKPWTNGVAETAVFGGKGNTITLAAPVTAGALKFTGDSYVLKGQPVHLGGKTPTLTVSGGKTAVFTNNLETPEELRKDGAGTLKLSSKTANSIPAKIRVTEGVLQIDSGFFGGRKAAANGTITVDKGARLEILASHALGGTNAGAPTDIHLTGGVLKLDFPHYFKLITMEGGALEGSSELRITTETRIVVRGTAPSRFNMAAISGGWSPSTLIFDVASTGTSGAPDLTVKSKAIHPTGATRHPFGIRKIGTGTLLLDAPNDFTEGCVLAEGVVKVSNPDALGGEPVEIAGATLVSTMENLRAGALTMKSGTLDLGGDACGKLMLAPDANVTMTGGVWRVTSNGAPDVIMGLGKATFSLDGVTIDFGGKEPPAGDHLLLAGFTSGSVKNVTFTGIDTEKTPVELDEKGVLHVSGGGRSWLLPTLGAGLLAVAAAVVVILRIRGRKSAPPGGVPAAPSPAVKSALPAGARPLPPPPGHR